MRSFARFKKSRGFTLVELMIVVAIIGVLAALAIYGVTRYLKTSKTSEAKNTIGGIARASAQAYDREIAANQLLADGVESATAMHALCDSAAAVPAAGPPLNKKYQPSTADGADFNAPAQGAADVNTRGWKCLKFSLTQPIYYQYAYGKGDAGGATGWTYGSAGGTATGFEVVAVGDTDGNNVNSYFARGGDVRAGAVVLSTQVYIKDEFE